MSAGKSAPLLVNEWAVFAHPLFLAQLEALTLQVEALKQKDPIGYTKKNASKRLAADIGFVPSFFSSTDSSFAITLQAR